MASFFLLLIQLLASVMLLLLPKSFFGLSQNVSVLGRLWLSTMHVFAVPLCLLLLAFSKNVFLKIAKLMWGAWVAFISGAVLLHLPQAAPGATLFGTVLVGAILVLGLSLFLFSMIELSRLIISHSSMPAAGKAEAKTHEQPPLPKIEGL